MSEELDVEFEKADIVLSDALVAFQDQGVSQYVYGMALLEIGIAALVKLEESVYHFGRLKGLYRKSAWFSGFCISNPTGTIN